MCNGFGMIVSSEIKGYFTMPCGDGDMSHTEILKALGWKENQDQFNRRFVRIECPRWTIESFRFDERESLPGWAEENTDAIKAMVKKALSKAAPAEAEYKKVHAPAYAEYEKVRDAAEAEYKKVHAPAYAEYKKVCDAAYAEYKKVRDAAEAEYEKVRDAAEAEYEKVRDAAEAELRNTLQKIDGFVY